MEKHSPGSSRPDTKFCQISMRDGLFIAIGDESVELEAQRHREKGVTEQVYVHYPYSIPPNPSVVLDLEDLSQDDRCIFHVPLKPIEQPEEGEVLPPCKICASSQPVPKESISSIHGIIPRIPSYTGLQVDPELVAAIVTLARSAQNDLIDPDLLTIFLSNPQLVEQEMKRLATSLATQKMPKPNSAERKPEHVALSHAGILPNMAAGMPISKKEHMKNIANEYGAHQSMGDKPLFPRPEYSISPVVPTCKYFNNTSNGCWNGFKCRFWHDMDARDAKPREGSHNRLVAYCMHSYGG